MSGRPKAFIVRHNEDEVDEPVFTESFVDSISGDLGDDDVIPVSYALDKRGLIVARHGCTVLENALGNVLARPDTCPFKELHRSSAAFPPVAGEYDSTSAASRGVAVAATVVLVSSDGCVLITQRARHMRTFPLVWVVPGGHVEADETLQAAALRELAEETGLDLSAEEIATCRVLCLWESCYPALLSQGPPRRHHICAYIRIQSSASAQELVERMMVGSDEVAAVSWLPFTAAAQVLDQSLQTPDASFPVFHIGEGGCKTMETRPLSVLLSSLPPVSGPWEHLSSGTMFAIRKVLQEHQDKDGAR